MKGRITALLATVAMLAVSLVAFVAGADPIQVWNGDLDGSTNANKIVTGIKGKPIPTLAVGALSYDGGSWYFGSAGGSVSPGAAGQALFTNDAGAATVWAYPHGDVDASATDPGALTVNAIQGIGVSTSVPSSTNVLAYSSGLWRPTAFGPVNMTPGTAGQVFVSNGTPAAAWTSLISYETTHGRFTIGGSGSDYKATIGPVSSAETTDVAVSLFSNSETANNSNFAIERGTLCQTFALHAGSTCFNAAGSGGTYGDVIFTNANGNASTQEALGRFDGVSGALFAIFGLNTGSAGQGVSITSSTTTPIIQSGNGATSLTLGTNKAGATLVLQADAATNVLTATSSALSVINVNLHVPSSTQFGSVTESFGGGLGVIGIHDASTAPTSAPSGGGVIYSQGGALKWIDSAGNTFTLAP